MTRKTSRRRGGRWRLAGLAVVVALLGMLAALGISLYRGATAPPDALLVLGGSIRREIYVAEQFQGPARSPILISQGSPAPCIWLIFERAGSALDQVWLEKCAQSTFENYVMALPVLKQWQTRHVRVVTSATHLPRSAWLGRILLGSHGIWVEMEMVPETGIPGNQESALKTALDVTRSLGWAVISQFYQPRCADIVALADLNWDDWSAEEFKCEHQGGLNLPN